jgi:hypothetical protein
VIQSRNVSFICLRPNIQVVINEIVVVAGNQSFLQFFSSLISYIKDGEEPKAFNFHQALDKYQFQLMMTVHVDLPSMTLELRFVLVTLTIERILVVVILGVRL